MAGKGRGGNRSAQGPAASLSSEIRPYSPRRIIVIWLSCSATLWAALVALALLIFDS